MMTRRLLEGALKWAARLLRRDDETARGGTSARVERLSTEPGGYLLLLTLAIATGRAIAVDGTGST